MTTEVIVMNRYGVALAADSAITVEGTNVYYTAKKIFPLGGNHQMAVIAYGKGHLMNVPWPVLISTFKHHLPNRPLLSVEHYVEHFLHYINDYDYGELMSPELEDNYIKELLYTKVDYLIKCCKKMHREIFKEYYKKLTMNQSQYIYNQKMEMMLSKILQRLKAKPFYQPFNEKDLSWLVDTYNRQLLQYLHEEKLSCFRTKEICQHMLLITYHSLLKENRIFKTNLVFIGYGQKSLLPEMITIEIGSKINRKLKYKLKDERIYQMKILGPGKIFTFGRSQMIEPFLSGIHNELEDNLFERLNEKLTDMPDEVEQILGDHLLDKHSRVKVVKRIEEKLIHVYYAVQKGALKAKQKQFIYPIESLVKAMPPQDLAKIAEELVVIETLKGKSSKAVERTQEPINVATITKGEGFQWVNNKNN